MNIYITGLGSGYEVEHLVRLFYPMAPLTLTPPEDGADCVWAEKRPDKLWAMVRQGGKSQTAEAPLPIPVEEGGDSRKMDESLRKFAALPVPAEAQVLPGHGDFSTFGQEAATNFYIKNALRNA